MLTVPAHELDIVIINNGGALAPTEAANKIVDAVLGDSVLGAPQPVPQSDRFKPMIGARYHSPKSGFELGFVDSEGKLAISVFNSQGLPLHEDGSTLRLNFQDVAIGPMVVETAALATTGAAPAELTVSEGGNAERFVRLPETAPALQVVGQGLLGNYRAHDLAADARVEFDGDALQLKVFGTFGVNTLLLEALSDGVFSWKAVDEMLPLRGVLTVERKSAEITGFRIDTPRTRHIWFERRANATSTVRS